MLTWNVFDNRKYLFRTFFWENKFFQGWISNCLCIWFSRPASYNDYLFYFKKLCHIGSSNVYVYKSRSAKQITIKDLRLELVIFGWTRISWNQLQIVTLQNYKANSKPSKIHLSTTNCLISTLLNDFIL